MIPSSNVTDRECKLLSCSATDISTEIRFGMSSLFRHDTASRPLGSAVSKSCIGVKCKSIGNRKLMKTIHEVSEVLFAVTLVQY